MQTPTADEVRTRSPLLTQRYPAGGPNEANFDALIEDSAAVVAGLTGRLILPVTEGEEVPAGLVSVAVRATARMAELMDTDAAADVADVTARGRRLRGFTAGPYSETYFAPGDLVVTKGARPQFSPDTALDRLLWALATEDAIDTLLALASGVQPPAGGVTPFDYRRTAGGLTGRGLPAGYGPDGW